MAINIAASRGFTRTLTDWFSDRSEPCPASGQPLVMQATGASDAAPSKTDFVAVHADKVLTRLLGQAR
jgi:hypothetical protein